MQHEAETTWMGAAGGLLLTLIALAGALRFIHSLDTNQGRHPSEQTRTDAQTIRSAIELYLLQNPGGRCPSLSELVAEHVLNGNTNTEDQWGREFAIDCIGDDVIVTSNGPDGVLGSPDDIR